MLVTQQSPLALSYRSTDYRNTEFQDVQKRVGTDNALYYWKLFEFYSDTVPDSFLWSTSTQPAYGASPPPRF
jgi:hypothetical protein